MRPGLSLSSLSFLVIYMSHSSASLVKIESVDELRRFSEDHLCYVIGYFENLNSAEAGLYRAAVAEEFKFKDDFAQTVCRGIPVAISSDDGVRKALAIKGEKGIVMISEGARSLFSFRNMDFPIRRWLEIVAKITLAMYYTWFGTFVNRVIECNCHFIKSEQNIKTLYVISVHFVFTFHILNLDISGSARLRIQHKSQLQCELYKLFCGIQRRSISCCLRSQPWRTWMGEVR
ncbi:hypothetical protein PMAYCL1PPCAC_14140, partial [Pristionchus mayeri]